MAADDIRTTVLASTNNTIVILIYKSKTVANQTVKNL